MDGVKESRESGELTMARRRRGKIPTVATEIAAHKGKALRGKPTGGKMMDLSQPLSRAASARPEVRKPRPYRTRYPIEMAAFRALKEAAKAKAKLKKKEASI